MKNKELTKDIMNNLINRAMERGLQDDTVMTWNIWNPFQGNHIFTGTYEQVQNRLIQDGVIFGSSGILIDGDIYETK